MKNYKFSLQSVLEVRDNEEKNVLEDFVLAQNNLDKEGRKKEELQRDLELCLEKKSSIKNIQELMMENLYKIDLEDKIKFQDMVIKEKKIELEEVRKKLQMAQKDKKIIEKLKEKDLDEYKAEIEKKSQKEIDEFAVLRFKTS
ncbi:flagellar export protein FliJ [Tissierella creatinophila]|uniref:Flagellar FliJ protein n=1 Tax=Tissierella creatinophila DSM 6911 TaxID=1123403 RepID=A0A1U7M919_TISCR|nr:flagellar export protein FliJ [Tissierella creatinophila]OLS03771.1 flagellar FliJ protein [Tissierella creatinophila DSM 6911]